MEGFALMGFCISDISLSIRFFVDISYNEQIIYEEVKFLVEFYVIQLVIGFIEIFTGTPNEYCQPFLLWLSLLCLGVSLELFPKIVF